MKFGKSFILILLVLLSVSFAPRAAAEEPAADKAQVVLRPVMKLSRGIANIALCWAEIPISWYETSNEMGGIAGITYGTLKGLCFTLARVGVGLTDIFTFPIPLPNCPDDPTGYGSGYGPIMTPAWVIDVDHDWQNFVYKREAIITDQN